MAVGKRRPHHNPRFSKWKNTPGGRGEDRRTNRSSTGKAPRRRTMERMQKPSRPGSIPERAEKRYLEEVEYTNKKEGGKEDE